MSDAQSIARQKMLTEPGHLYAAYSRYCDWIKIGFTSKSVTERMEGINRAYPLFAPFSLIGSIRSTWDGEQQAHSILRPLRQGKKASTGELYPACPSVVLLVKNMLAKGDFRGLETNERLDLRLWVNRVARHPLNRVEAKLAFERFHFERKPFADQRRPA